MLTTILLIELLFGCGEKRNVCDEKFVDSVGEEKSYKVKKVSNELYLIGEFENDIFQNGVIFYKKGNNIRMLIGTITYENNEMYYYGNESTSFSSYLKFVYKKDFANPGISYTGKFKINSNYNESLDSLQGYIRPNAGVTYNSFLGSRKDGKLIGRIYDYGCETNGSCYEPYTFEKPYIYTSTDFSSIFENNDLKAATGKTLETAKQNAINAKQNLKKAKEEILKSIESYKKVFNKIYKTKQYYDQLKEIFKDSEIKKIERKDGSTDLEEVNGDEFISFVDYYIN